MLAQGQVMGGLKRTRHHLASWRPTSGCSVGAQWRGAGSSGLVDRAQAWTPGRYSRGRIDHSVIHLEPSKDAVISQISCDFDLFILFSNYLLNTYWVQGFDTHFRYKDEQGRGYPCPQVACRLLGKEAPDFMANYLFTVIVTLYISGLVPSSLKLQ